jgi:cysteine synthase A
VAAAGFDREVVDRGTYDRAVDRFRQAGIMLPTIAQLAEPAKLPSEVLERLRAVGADDADPLNLFRVHWYNDDSRTGRADVPRYVVLPTTLTGVDATIAVVLGDRFPMIAAHKVLAAYGCLAPRVVTGRFDPSTHRAVWPSTGNYCRGGVAISRIMGCRGVAVLPEGMSRERFEWLHAWVAEPEDVIRTPGTESNVKEIYDECARLALDDANVILNQFSEFGNHLVHYACTGRALDHVFEDVAASHPGVRLRAFVAASGSAGTLGAGDYLKDRHDSLIAAVEALECPTMLRNGFGEHNIQGIGDKHIPLIHNVMNTDVVVAVSDRSTDRLNVLFNSEVGRAYLAARRGVPAELVEALASFGLSSICNVIASIKLAKHLEMGAEDVVITVATDGAAMYRSELDKVVGRDFQNGFDEPAAAETFAEHVLGARDDHLLDLGPEERDRIFNLGYFTWVEQQGVPIDDFVSRRQRSFWRDLRDAIEVWDGMIKEFNRRTGVSGAA